MSDKIYDVPAEWRKRAFVDDAKYKEMYDRSIKDPNGFWAEHAKRVDWIKPFSKVKNTTYDPHNVSIKWFEDGTLNACYNCVDRHLATRGDRTAIIWAKDEAGEYERISYRQLYRDPNLDVWLICWVDGQNTGYHDHDRSSGAVCICEGTLYEDWFRVEEDGWVRERTTEHGAGGRFDFDASDIHGVRHPGADAPPATSIHFYSPALWRMGHYEPGPRGMRRVGMTYAEELHGAA